MTLRPAPLAILAIFALALPAFAEKLQRWQTPSGGVYVGNNPPAAASRSAKTSAQRRRRATTC